MDIPDLSRARIIQQLREAVALGASPHAHAGCSDVDAMRHVLAALDAARERGAAAEACLEQIRSRTEAPDSLDALRNLLDCEVCGGFRRIALSGLPAMRFRDCACVEDAKKVLANADNKRLMDTCAALRSAIMRALALCMCEERSCETCAALDAGLVEAGADRY